MTKEFNEIDHSGDVGIEAWGSDRADLLANLARGLFSLQATGRVESSVEHSIDVRSGSADELIVDWLSELITASATLGEVFADVAIDVCDETRASGRVWGEAVDEARHELRFDVKAATYHGLVNDVRDSVYYARVIFDL